MSDKPSITKKITEKDKKEESPIDESLDKSKEKMDEIESNNSTSNTKHNTKNNTTDNHLNKDDNVKRDTSENTKDYLLNTIKKRSNKTPDKKRVNIYAEKKLLKALDFISEKENISRSELYNIAAKFLIEKLERVDNY